MESEHKTLILSIFFGACLSMVLTLIPIWQLVIIPAIITGIINQKMRDSIIAGILSILIPWSIYIGYGLATRNVYVILDQLGTLIFGAGFAWVFLLIVFLSSIIIGALGGGLGNKFYLLIKILIRRNVSNSTN